MTARNGGLPVLDDVAVVRLRSRWARGLGAVWLAAAGVWLVADLLLLATTGRLAWDLFAVPVLVAVGLSVGRASVEIDADGFVLRDGWRSHRVLWAAVERIDVDFGRRLDAPVRIHLRRDDAPLPVQASWGARPEQREALIAALRAAATSHAIPVHVR